MLSNDELRENLKRLGLIPSSDRKRMIPVLKKHLRQLAKEQSPPPQPSSSQQQPSSAAKQQPSPPPHTSPTGNRPRTPLYKVSLPSSPAAESSRSQEPSKSSIHAS